MQTSLADLAHLRFGRGDDYSHPAWRGPQAASLWARFRGLALALTVLSGAGAWADTITLAPIADTSLFEEVPDNNLGGLTHIPAGTTVLSKRSRALFKFDLTQI